MKRAVFKLDPTKADVKCPAGAKLIPLTKGKFAIVDEELHPDLDQYNWFFSGRYAVRWSEVNGKKVKLWMHREILSTPYGMNSDHRDRNTLDNRRINLRICSHAQNMSNRGAHKTNKLGLKGVCLDRDRMKYTAQIQVNKKNIHLGSFSTPEAAYATYCEAAKRFHGEFARTA